MTVDAPPRQLTDLLRSLRAVREFQRKPLPEEIVQDVLEVARWSGSASNRQFGQIIVVRQRETLEALATIGGYTGHLRGAALAMVPAGTRPRPQPRCWDSPGSSAPGGCISTGRPMWSCRFDNVSGHLLLRSHSASDRPGRDERRGSNAHRARVRSPSWP